ncbi:MAG TPA: hypothetical protein VKX17_05030 [Planctomycetota bacterium]|nr:hypothetical protein [Planctomycetota bacterium]
MIDGRWGKTWQEIRFLRAKKMGVPKTHIAISTPGNPGITLGMFKPQGLYPTIGHFPRPVATVFSARQALRVKC